MICTKEELADLKAYTEPETINGVPTNENYKNICFSKSMENKYTREHWWELVREYTGEDPDYNIFL